MVRKTWFKPYRDEAERDREIGFLGALQPYMGFPKVVQAHTRGIRLSWCGYDVEKMLSDGYITLGMLGASMVGLLHALAQTNIRHRDVKVHNMLWHPHLGAHLVDFGTAIWTNTEENVCPEDRWPDAWFMEMSDLEQLIVTLAGLERGKPFTTKEEWDGYCGDKRRKQAEAADADPEHSDPE